MSISLFISEKDQFLVVKLPPQGGYFLYYKYKKIFFFFLVTSHHLFNNQQTRFEFVIYTHHTHEKKKNK